VIPPGAHIAGLPVEETIASFGPVLLVALGVWATMLRARFRRRRAPGSERVSRAKTAPPT
jgi:hypothetical protein